MRDEVVRMGGPRRGDDLLVAGIRFAIGDVIAHIAGEQGRLLRHQGDMLAQLLQAQFTDVPAIQQHPALLRVIKAL